MDRIKTLKSIAEKYATSFIGYGNPKSDILIIGNECSFDPESKWPRDKTFNKITYYNNAQSWQKYCESPVDSKEIPDWKDTMEWDWEKNFNPRFAFKGQLYSVAEYAYGATSQVWFTYQKLLDIYRGVKRSSGRWDNWNGYLIEPDTLDFMDHCFITEFSDNPMEKSQPSSKTEESVKNRISSLFKEDFFQSFPIVVVASREYVKQFNIDLSSLFPSSRIVVANLLNRTPSAKYLDGVVAKMRANNPYCAKYKPLHFVDPYGKTSLSSRKTLLFCAYCHFTIPHDVVGAILYSEALSGAAEVYFGRDVLDLFTPSLHSFIDDVDWYLAAIKSMGYPDIVDEFNRNKDNISRFVKERFASADYDTHEVVRKIESLVRPEYMEIIKKSNSNI